MWGREDWTYGQRIKTVGEPGGAVAHESYPKGLPCGVKSGEGKEEGRVCSQASRAQHQCLRVKRDRDEGRVTSPDDCQDVGLWARAQP